MSAHVLIVEDFQELLKSYTAVLIDAGYRVSTACRLIEACTLIEDEPMSLDVALIDYALPDGVGTSLLPLLEQTQPGVRVAIITAYAAADIAIDLISDNVPIVPKPLSAREITNLVRALLPDNGTDEHLSKREREVLRLLRSGLTLKQISATLGLSEPTVKTYWRRIRLKAGLHSQRDAILRKRFR